MDGVDKYHNLSTPEVTIEMRDRMLNRGIEKFIKQRYGGNNVKGLGFEEIQKRTDDIRSLVEYSTLTSSGAGFIQKPTIKSVNYTLPIDYWFLIWNQGLITISGCPSQIVTIDCNGNKTYTDNTKQVAPEIKNRRHNEIETICNDPFNRPEGIEGIFTVEYKDKISVFIDNTLNLDSYQIGYIQSFQRVKNGTSYSQVSTSSLYWKTLEFWFPNHTHSEIVDIAVQSALEVFEQPRTQTHIQELSSHE
jgi:hypothetical protein